jgi:Spy/CpxP family protein refolding chaperone
MCASKLLLPLLLLSLALPVLAQPLLPSHPQPRLNLQELGLSDDQKSQIRALQQVDKLKLQDLRKQLTQAQQVLRSSVIEGDSDPEVRQNFEKLQQTSVKVARLRLENLLRIRKVLTPEQLKQLKTHSDNGNGAESAN